MDELELLKQDWQRDTVSYPELSHNDIYKMIHAKSSSIVKWIFYISIAEFSIITLLTLLNPNIDTQFEFPLWLNWLSYLSIPVIIGFVIIFYKNYKGITSTDSVKSLIAKILKTRRTVKYYVLFNLIIAGIFSSIGMYVGYMHASGGVQQFSSTAHFKEYAILGVTIFIVTILVISIFYGVYYLLYGILLKRLNKNYKELKKLEI